MSDTSSEVRRWIRPCTVIWLVLMALTLVTLGIGKLGLSGTGVVAFIMTTTFIKGQMVADYFMGLKQVRWSFRIITLLYMVIVCGLILVAYMVGLNG